MFDFPNEGSFWNLFKSANMGFGSTSNSQFPGFSSQAPLTPEQQAFLQTQQQAFVDQQNRQQNPPQYQQSQSSNSLSQTESQPKRGRVKCTAKKGKVPEPIGDVTLRWQPEEETLLAECFVAVFEDRNIRRSQPKDTLWFRVLNEFNRKNFQKHEDVPNEHVSAVNTDELFGPDARPRPPGKQHPEKKTKSDTSAITGGSSSSTQFGEFMSHELRLKREAAEKAFEVSKEKDRTITRLEELRFLALSTTNLSDDDAYSINLQKAAIKEKLRLQIPRPSNNNDDDETEEGE
nr:hypothetical protein [Tanacetum cinerariifolium]